MSATTDRVRLWFDLPRRPRQRGAAGRALPSSPPRLRLAGDRLRALLPAPGESVLITGPSGSGKSTLLAQLREAIPCNQVDVTSIPLPRRGRRATVELVADALAPRAGSAGIGDGDADVDDARLVAALEVLSRVGLAEAADYLRPPGRLSEGQRFRLRLAVALARCAAADASPGARTILTCDEFAAPLDDLTAAVVCRCVRRSIDSAGGALSAVVVTGRSAVASALRPDAVVRCDFGTFALERPPANHQV